MREMKMKTLVSQNWNGINRSEKIESILTVLSCSGTAEVEYFKGKSNIISYLLWKGNPQPVNEDDEWNYARIIYQGKVALEFLELRVHLFSSAPEFEGHLFDEHFTEHENKHILDALRDAEIFTYRANMSKSAKMFLSFSMVFYTLFALHSLKNGSYGISVLLLCCTIILAWLLFRK